MAGVTIDHFGDPACPCDYSAEPARLRLSWLFGEQITWRLVMVGLSEEPGDYYERGYTHEGHARGLERIQRLHGMPIDTRERSRMIGTVPACRAVVAVRLHAPDREHALLRRLRILAMGGELTDDQDVLARAAREAGLTALDLRWWMTDPEVEAALRADMDAARRPAPQALALDERLAAADRRGRGRGRRYTCPTYDIRGAGGARLVLPGFQPIATYELALANVAPELQRRADPASVEEVLEWAGEPLATAEVAAIRGVDQQQTRSELAEVAALDPVGADGFWRLSADAQRLAA